MDREGKNYFIAQVTFINQLVELEIVHSSGKPEEVLEKFANAKGYSIKKFIFKSDILASAGAHVVQLSEPGKMLLLSVNYRQLTELE
ncbi:hypothetical protein HYT01_01050 [Candidatus Giovannonibacteria bacterium]|nr:hypothetical protein [Candidatus Giovannonibacteria bacterium]